MRKIETGAGWFSARISGHHTMTCYRIISSTEYIGSLWAARDRDRRLTGATSRNL
jgi:hypothetical protein